jgi:hypothetical protein
MILALTRTKYHLKTTYTHNLTPTQTSLPTYS